ncbi:hypothetical protein HDU76_013815 [Blyttiomyces sp. JEL0837]|nr:hypothetical protein HDU76_013815 [Blyttiomyces sp. JEL0837]
MALVIGDDKLSIRGGEDVESAMIEGGVTILTKISLSSFIIESGDYSTFYNTLRNVDARYIVIIAAMQTTSDFYYGSRKFSLISPEHVYLGWNLPLPADLVLADDLVPYMQGYIYTTQDSPEYDSAPVQAFNETWTMLSEQNSSVSYPPFDSAIFYTGAYDCVKLMMQGIHEFMVANPQYTPEMLANGSLSQHLTPDKFAKTAYQGVNYNPVTLNQYGDLNIPLLFFTTNYSQIVDESYPFDRSTGMDASLSLKEANEIGIHKAQIFRHQMDQFQVN